MARDSDGKPKETRGRRGMSQKIRDLAEQMKGWSSLGEGMPKWIESASSLGFMGWIVMALRPRIDITLTNQPLTQSLQGGISFLTPGLRYNGKLIKNAKITHPYGRGGPWLASELVILFNITSGDLWEIAKEATILLIHHDLYDNYMFPETYLDIAGYALDIRLKSPGTPEAVQTDVTGFITKKLIERWITVFAFAGFMVLLMKRTISTTR